MIRLLLVVLVNFLIIVSGNVNIPNTQPKIKRQASEVNTFSGNHPPLNLQSSIDIGFDDSLPSEYSISNSDNYKSGFSTIVEESTYNEDIPEKATGQRTGKRILTTYTSSNIDTPTITGPVLKNSFKKTYKQIKRTQKTSTSPDGKSIVTVIETENKIPERDLKIDYSPYYMDDNANITIHEEKEIVDGSDEVIPENQYKEVIYTRVRPITRTTITKTRTSSNGGRNVFVDLNEQTNENKSITQLKDINDQESKITESVNLTESPQPVRPKKRRLRKRPSSRRNNKVVKNNIKISSQNQENSSDEYFDETNVTKSIENIEKNDYKSANSAQESLIYGQKLNNRSRYNKEKVSKPRKLKQFSRLSSGKNEGQIEFVKNNTFTNEYQSENYSQYSNNGYNSNNQRKYGKVRVLKRKQIVPASEITIDTEIKSFDSENIDVISDKLNNATVTILGNQSSDLKILNSQNQDQSIIVTQNVAPAAYKTKTNSTFSNRYLSNNSNKAQFEINGKNSKRNFSTEIDNTGYKSFNNLSRYNKSRNLFTTNSGTSGTRTINSTQNIVSKNIQSPKYDNKLSTVVYSNEPTRIVPSTFRQQRLKNQYANARRFETQSQSSQVNNLVNTNNVSINTNNVTNETLIPNTVSIELKTNYNNQNLSRSDQSSITTKESVFQQNYSENSENQSNNNDNTQDKVDDLSLILLENYKTGNYETSELSSSQVKMLDTKNISSLVVDSSLVSSKSSSVRDKSLTYKNSEDKNANNIRNLSNQRRYQQSRRIITTDNETPLRQSNLEKQTKIIKTESLAPATRTFTQRTNINTQNLLKQNINKVISGNKGRYNQSRRIFEKKLIPATVKVETENIENLSPIGVTSEFGSQSYSNSSESRENKASFIQKNDSAQVNSEDSSVYNKNTGTQRRYKKLKRIVTKKIKAPVNDTTYNTQIKTISVNSNPTLVTSIYGLSTNTQSFSDLNNSNSYLIANKNITEKNPNISKMSTVNKEESLDGAYVQSSDSSNVLKNSVTQFNTENSNSNQIRRITTTKEVPSSAITYERQIKIIETENSPQTIVTSGFETNTNTQNVFNSNSATLSKSLSKTISEQESQNQNVNESISGSKGRYTQLRRIGTTRNLVPTTQVTYNTQIETVSTANTSPSVLNSTLESSESSIESSKLSNDQSFSSNVVKSSATQVNTANSEANLQNINNQGRYNQVRRITTTKEVPSSAITYGRQVKTIETENLPQTIVTSAYGTNTNTQSVFNSNSASSSKTLGKTMSEQESQHRNVNEANTGNKGRYTQSRRIVTTQNLVPVTQVTYNTQIETVSTANASPSVVNSLVKSSGSSIESSKLSNNQSSTSNVRKSTVAQVNTANSETQIQNFANEGRYNQVRRITTTKSEVPSSEISYTRQIKTIKSDSSPSVVTAYGTNSNIRSSSNVNNAEFTTTDTTSTNKAKNIGETSTGNRYSQIRRVITTENIVPASQTNYNSQTKEETIYSPKFSSRSQQGTSNSQSFVSIEKNTAGRTIADQNSYKNKIQIEVNEPRSYQVFRKRNETTRNHEFIPIIDSKNFVYSHSGAFDYSYEGADGTKAFGSGKLKTVENDQTGEAVIGGFSYTGKDGRDYSLTYTADENGYRPVGDHLPTPPPIPPAIAKALAYLATKPEEPTTERMKTVKSNTNSTRTTTRRVTSSRTVISA